MWYQWARIRTDLFSTVDNTWTEQLAFRTKDGISIALYKTRIIWVLLEVDNTDFRHSACLHMLRGVGSGHDIQWGSSDVLCVIQCNILMNVLKESVMCY